MVWRTGRSSFLPPSTKAAAAVKERIMKTLKSHLRLPLVAVGFGLLLTAGSASAHHAFSAEFDADKPVTLHGTLTKMEWSNPHGWIYLDVKEADGSTNNWAVEFGTPNALVRRGLRKSDFVVASEIVVAGFQAKDGTHTANGRTLTFADGREFFVGAEGTPVLPGTGPRR
jgi:hypothetical protein